MKFKTFYLQEKLGKNYQWSCLLFDFPREISQEIQNWSKFNISDEFLSKDGRENETHVTILYGIHEANPWKSFLAVEQVKPFELTLGEMSKFDAPDCDVLKIEVFSRDLHMLREYLEDSIENTQTHSEYKPHVTIAFVKKGSCDKFLGNDLFKGRQVLMNAVDFSSKDGTRHRKYFNNVEI